MLNVDRAVLFVQDKIFELHGIVVRSTAKMVFIVLYIFLAYQVYY